MKRNRLVTFTLVIVVVSLVVVTVAVSGGGAAKLKTTPVNAQSALSVKHTALGNTLVDGNGRAVYLFRADKPNRSTLPRAGFAVWPAFGASGTTPQATAGVNAAHIGTIRSDGRRQLTYYGHPLYYYVGDKGPGEVKGQGLSEFGALWYVLSPNGRAVTNAPSTTAPTTTESSGYGY
jgi:predicted lipoprotein with Yx(FWY)xxD motif